MFQKIAYSNVIRFSIEIKFVIIISSIFDLPSLVRFQLQELFISEVIKMVLVAIAFVLEDKSTNTNRVEIFFTAAASILKRKLNKWLLIER